MYSGGAESVGFPNINAMYVRLKIQTVAGVECFILAMVLCTAAQQKAQEEIDRVIGVGVLPTLADRARLPYVEALFLEVLRKYTFAPIGWLVIQFLRFILRGPQVFLICYQKTMSTMATTFPRDQ